MYWRRFCFARSAVLLLLALPVLAAGCGKATSVVSGKVTYKGRPLPIGTVLFLTSENKVLAGEITGDGDYSVSRVPPGEVKISVAVPSPNTLRPQQKGMHGKADENTSFQPAQKAPNVVKIPDVYANADTSGLKYTVTAEPTQTHNLDLK